MSDRIKNKKPLRNKSNSDSGKIKYPEQIITRISKIQSLPSEVVIDFLNSQGTKKYLENG